MRCNLLRSPELSQSLFVPAGHAAAIPVRPAPAFKRRPKRRSLPPPGPLLISLMSAGLGFLMGELALKLFA